MYADDIGTICSENTFSDLQDNINNCLYEVASWFNENHLVVNASKSNFMLVGTRQKLSSIQYPFEVYVNNTKLQECNTAKLLGVILDQHLCFDHHVKYLCDRVSPKIGLLHRLRRILPIEALNTIYITCLYYLLT